jgi:hypothetical protein
MLIETMNSRLERLYGKEVISGKAKYRIVRSETQTEKKYGSYDILTQETGIWLGVKQGLVEIKKYWYLKDCWLLERVEPNLNRKDTLYDKWSYEPIFPFLDKNDNELPVVWKVVELIVGKIERAAKHILTEKDLVKQEEKELQDERDRIFGILDKPEPTKPLPTFEKSTLIKPIVFPPR